MKNVLKALHIKASDKEVQQLMKMMDKDGMSGVI
jgi:Ca2+-binding EF-hand superfamily protein